MRLWSLHPSYLDSIGLVALWREGLLARKVLLGQTKGYTHHPQLIRFRETEKTQDKISAEIFPFASNHQHSPTSSIPDIPRRYLSMGEL